MHMPLVAQHLSDILHIIDIVNLLLCLLCGITFNRLSGYTEKVMFGYMGRKEFFLNPQRLMFTEPEARRKTYSSRELLPVV